MNSNENSDFIKVCVRIRPSDQSFDKLRNICVRSCSDDCVILSTSKSIDKRFTFDYVADWDATQESIFRVVGKHIIDDCFEGYNGTIFAYGQTGSGKTYTMLGPDSMYCPNAQAQGLIPRCLDYLFSLIDRKRALTAGSIEFLCKCSFIEIYQEVVYDLLNDVSVSLQVRENIKFGTFVEGVTECVISSAAEAAKVLEKGWLNRTVASTSMNRESSRSHAVFTLFLESRERIGDIVNIRTSQLNLVDLAGSERQKDTNTAEVRLKEAGSINKSLSVLGNVMTALLHRSQGKSRHVPYRDSKLTFLLRDSLGGNARTCIVATIHPNAKCFGETLSTLQFASRAKQVRNKAVANEDVSAANISSLQAEIKRLKKELCELRYSDKLPTDKTSDVPDFSMHSKLNEAESAQSMHELSKKLKEATKVSECLKAENIRYISEIKTLNKTVNELDTALRASRFQREILNEMHVTSINALTPTKKARRRTFYTPGSVKTGATNFSSEFDEDYFSNLPKEDLLEEFLKIRDQNVALETKIDTQQREILRLEAGENCLNQIINEERKKCTSLVSELKAEEQKWTSKVEETTALLQKALRDSEFATSEASDLKIMMNLQDRKLAEMKTIIEEQKIKLEGATVEELQFKVKQLEKSVADLSEQLEIASEDKEELMNRIEILDAQCSFDSELMQDLEDRLLAEEKKVGDAQLELRILSEKNEQVSDLCVELADSKRCIEKTPEINKSLNAQIEDLKRILAAEVENFHEETQKLHNVSAENQQLRSELTELHAQYNSLTAMFDEKCALILKIEEHQKMIEATRVGRNDKESPNVQPVILMNENSSMSRSQDVDQVKNSIVPACDSPAEYSNLLQDLQNRLLEKEQELQHYREKVVSFDALIEDYHLQRNEKNEEISGLKALNENLTNQLNKDNRLISDVPTSDRAEKWSGVDMFDELTADIKRLRRENEFNRRLIDELNEAIKENHEKSVHKDEQLERLKNAEQKLFSEKEDLRSQLRELSEVTANQKKLIFELNEKLAAEQTENAKLSGHSNNKQRIHYIDALRTEMTTLRERMQKLEKENDVLSAKLSRSQTRNSSK